MSPSVTRVSAESGSEHPERYTWFIFGTEPSATVAVYRDEVRVIPTRLGQYALRSRLLLLDPLLANV